MSDCDTQVYNGTMLRYIVTILAFLVLAINMDKKYIKNNIYLLFPCLLLLLDFVDGIFLNIFTLNGYIHNNIASNIYFKCTKQYYYYQISDKICDTISYLFTYFFLRMFVKVDVMLLWFILYRIIGVALFYVTKNSIWFVVFFDFIKEYLLYTYLFSTNYVYLLFFILCKIAFEYGLHRVFNQISDSGNTRANKLADTPENTDKSLHAPMEHSGVHMK
jgi:hypothetical protein